MSNLKGLVGFKCLDPKEVESSKTLFVISHSWVLWSTYSVLFFFYAPFDFVKVIQNEGFDHLYSVVSQEKPPSTEIKKYDSIVFENPDFLISRCTDSNH